MDDTDVTVEDIEVTDGVGRIVAPCPGAVVGARAGQFVLVRSLAPGAPLLPRPLSILFDGRRLELLFNVVGAGTRALAALLPGDPLHVVGPLGTPFASPGGRLAIVADGSHAGTMLGLARERGGAARVVYVASGAAADGRLVAAFRATGATVEVVPLGRLAAALAWLSPERIAAGAADPVMATVQSFAAERGVPGEAALQAPMACGLGACHVCVRRFAEGFRLVCEGPVFDLQEAVFGDTDAHG